VSQAVKERGAYQWIQFKLDESSFLVDVTHVNAVEVPNIKLSSVEFREILDEKGYYIGFINKKT